MPATAAQVFGPTTVDPGFNSTGEKTLLTMNTTLSAGGRNVIIVSFVKSSTSLSAKGTYRIYKGSTLLYESKISSEYFTTGGMRAKHVLLVAVDNAPSGNDSYSFRINITTADTVTTSVCVQGIVIKASDASWAYNTTAVSIAAGGTATVTSMSTSFPANSKVALVAVCYGSWSGTGAQLVGVGNIKLKVGTTVVASNQFNIGSYESIQPLWVSLIYLDTPTSGSQTYSVEVTNGSSQTFNFYAEIVAFTVFDAAFLDTASVALTNGSQVTVGNLTTSLGGNVLVIGLAAAENTTTSGVTAFNANDVVLQLNNSMTGQISNLVGWYLESTSAQGRSGILPLFRLDTLVSNPSYQIKMTARANGINGEAKILAFSLGMAYSISLTESLGLLDNVPKSISIFKSESLGLTDTYGRTYSGFRTLTELLGLRDAPSKQISLIKLERLGLLDSVEALRVYLIELIERLGLSDSFTRKHEAYRTFIESLGLSDSYSRTFEGYRTLQESLGLSDSLKRATNKVILEKVGLLDSLRRTTSIARVLTEVIGLSDTTAGYHYRGLPITGDRPDFTGKSATTIIGQVTDLKLLYDEKSPLAINIAKMVAEKLTVMAPSLQAVSVGGLKLYMYDFYTPCLEAGESYKIIEVTGRGRAICLICQIYALDEAYPFRLGDIKYRCWWDMSEPGWSYSFRVSEEEAGGVALAYLSGKPAGIYFPPTSPDRHLNIYVIKTTDTAPTYDPGAHGYGTMDYLNIYYMGFKVEFNTEFEKNFGLRILHDYYSYNCFVCHGVFIYGLYP
jgi:hypothetical protein